MAVHRELNRLLILYVLASRCLSSAPDDAELFCTNSTLVSTPPPAYPPNTRILMDSYQYINLLPPHFDPVWQMVDNDINNIAGRGTEWTQNTNIPCRNNVNACGFAVGTQNNWLITQHIRRTVSNYTRVSVLVEFELRGCDTAACRRTFAIYKYESSELNPSDVRNISRFQRAGRIATEDDSGQTRENRTIEVDLNTNENGFYLAIVDETTCIGVTRVIVFYNVCPEGVVNLLNRPETLAPRFDRNSESINVSAKCVDGSNHQNQATVYLSCSPRGVWFPMQDAGCRCNQGLKPSEDGQFCEGCPTGTYLSTQQLCLNCPRNSHSMVPGVLECPCQDGYYRAPGEEDLPCTQPPSTPRNLVITSTTPTSINLAWDPPESLGGRNDTRYTIWYQEIHRNRVRAGTSDHLSGMITGLRAGTEYRIFVAATNGVSELAAMDQFLNNTLVFIDGITESTEVASSLGIALGVSFGVLAIIVTLVPIILMVIRLLHGKKKGLFARKATDMVSNFELSKEISFQNKQDHELSHFSVQSSFSLNISQKLIIPSCNLKLGAILGQGEFGVVYKGYIKKTGISQNISGTVAVKTLKGFIDKNLVHDLLKECGRMYNFDHPNVLKLTGVCLDGGPAPFIIMPFMANGSLNAYLKRDRENFLLDPEITSPDDAISVKAKLLDMCIQVGKGMEYLASMRVIHRDLAARNCMMDMNLVIKVADFGLAENTGASKDYFRQDQEDTRMKLPIKWMALESIHDKVFSEKSDVWSYGVTCWEIFSGGKTPYPGIHTSDLPQQLDKGYRMKQPCNAACTDDIYSFMMKCWNADASLRPTFAEVVKELSGVLGMMAEYLNFSDPKL